MTTYQKLKEDFFTCVKITGRNPTSSARLMNAAWFQHMEQIVCGRAKGVHSNGVITGSPSNFDFPDPTNHPIVVSKTHAAVPSVIGGIVLKTRRKRDDLLPVSVAAENARAWVAVKIDDQLVAVTIQEAFERALPEVEMPRASRGRPSIADEQRLTERTEIRMTLEEKRRYIALGGQKGFREYLRQQETGQED